MFFWRCPLCLFFLSRDVVRFDTWNVFCSICGLRVVVYCARVLFYVRVCSLNVGVVVFVSFVL